MSLAHRHTNSRTCLRRSLRMWYSAYGVDEERVTLSLSPGVMVSSSDSGQYRALFSCGAGQSAPLTEMVAHSTHLHTFGQHDNSFDLILPHHPPEMVNCIIHRSCESCIKCTFLSSRTIPWAAMYLFPRYPCKF